MYFYKNSSCFYWFFHAFLVCISFISTFNLCCFLTLHALSLVLLFSFLGSCVIKQGCLFKGFHFSQHGYWLLPFGTAFVYGGSLHIKVVFCCCFWDSFLVFNICQLKYNMHLCGFFRVILFWTLWVSWIWMFVSFLRLGTFSVIIYLNKFCVHSLSSRSPLILESLLLSRKSLKLSSVFFFFLCHHLYNEFYWLVLEFVRNLTDICSLADTVDRKLPVTC